MLPAYEETGIIRVPAGYVMLPGIVEAVIEKAPAGRHGSNRVIYIKASTEKPDHEDEIITSEALQKGSSDFLREGWLDWNHYSNPNRLPEALAKAGHTPQQYMIGYPEAFRVNPARESLVKGRLLSTPAADQAWTWAEQAPERLKASIGGGYLERKREFSKSLGRHVNRVMGVYWNHLALCPQAVNSETMVSTVPFAEFVKSANFFCPEICLNDCRRCPRARVLSKALDTSGAYGTSHAAMVPEDLEGSSTATEGQHCDHIAGNKFTSWGAALDHMLSCKQMPKKRALEILERARLRSEPNAKRS